MPRTYDFLMLGDTSVPVSDIIEMVRRITAQEGPNCYSVGSGLTAVDREILGAEYRITFDPVTFLFWARRLDGWQIAGSGPDRECFYGRAPRPFPCMSWVDCGVQQPDALLRDLTILTALL